MDRNRTDRPVISADRLELDDQDLIVTMHQYGQALRIRRSMAQTHVADMKRVDLLVGQAVQVLAQVEVFAHQFGKMTSRQLGGRHSQPVFGIFAGLQDLQAGFIDHQHKAMRLDAAGNLDRFLAATLDGLIQCGVGSRQERFSWSVRSIEAGGSGAGSIPCTVPESAS